MFETLLTKSAVEKLGFVDYETVQAAMETAWGEKADSRSFRVLVYCGAWITLSERLGVATATEADWN
jgi:asparagine synthase (glutamine-hydrolysing)